MQNLKSSEAVANDFLHMLCSLDIHPEGLEALAFIKFSGFGSIDEQVLQNLISLCNNLRSLTVSAMTLLGQDA